MSRSRASTGLGGLEQPVLAGGGGQLAQPRAEHEPALQVAGDQAVVLQGDGEPVRGRPGQPGGGDQGGQGGRAGLEGAQNDGGLVENADSARVVHVPILPSQPPRRKSMARLKERTVPRTLAEKVWDAHVVRRAEGEPDLLYIDLHLVHEVTSPQAFDGLRLAGRPVRRPDLTIATEDHNVPTHRHRPADRRPGVADPGRDAARATAPSSASRCTRLGDRDQGIVHVVGPQLGPDPAGHDRRLRRLAHLDPRRVRRAGVRHRHQRGRARARHPDAAADARSRRWRSPSTATLAAGRHRQGPDPRRHRARSAPAAARATSSSTAARRSARCRWRRG